jgi:hypothetical protein
MAVNAGWGPRGAATYDIWLYKGGGNCHHYWVRKTYRAVDVQPDIKNPNAEISVNKARREGLDRRLTIRELLYDPLINLIMAF